MSYNDSDTQNNTEQKGSLRQYPQNDSFVSSTITLKMLQDNNYLTQNNQSNISQAPFVSAKPESKLMKWFWPVTVRKLLCITGVSALVVVAGYHICQLFRKQRR